MSDAVQHIPPKHGLMPFPEDLLEFMRREQLHVDMFVNYGGLPSPLSPEHYHLCLGLAQEYKKCIFRRHKPFIGFDVNAGETFLEQLDEEIIANPFKGRWVTPGPEGGDDSVGSNNHMTQLAKENGDLTARVTLLENDRKELDTAFHNLKATTLQLHADMAELKSSLEAKVATVDSRVTETSQALAKSIATQEVTLKSELAITLDSKLVPVYDQLSKAVAQLDAHLATPDTKDSAPQYATHEADFTATIANAVTKGLNEALDTTIKPLCTQLADIVAQQEATSKTTKESTGSEDKTTIPSAIEAPGRILEATESGVIERTIDSAADLRSLPSATHPRPDPDTSAPAASDPVPELMATLKRYLDHYNLSKGHFFHKLLTYLEDLSLNDPEKAKRIAQLSPTEAAIQSPDEEAGRLNALANKLKRAKGPWFCSAIGS